MSDLGDVAPPAPAASTTARTPSVATRPAATPPVDWTVRAVDGIDSAVGMVRSKIQPIVNAIRWVAFGVIIAFLAVAAFLMIVIAAIRLIVVYIPPHQVYFAD